MRNKGLLKELSKTIDSRCLHKGKLRKEGCSVPLTGVPSTKLIVDFDKAGSPLGPNEPKCDYFVVIERQTNSNLALALELQRGTMYAKKVYAQLSAGARAGEDIVPIHLDVKFLPVVAYGNTTKREIIELRKDSFLVRFHGQSKAIKLVSCGTPLSRVEEFD